MTDNKNIKKISSKITFLDFVLIFAAFFFAAAVVLLTRVKTDEKKCVCIVNGKETTYYSFSVDRTVTLKTKIGQTVVKIEEGRAFISSSDCENQICVNSKCAENIGDTIICAPSNVAVMITESGGGVYEKADAAAG